eukprot:575478-Amphidinium_carterae.4
MSHQKRMFPATILPAGAQRRKVAWSATQQLGLKVQHIAMHRGMLLCRCAPKTRTFMVSLARIQAAEGTSVSDSVESSRCMRQFEGRERERKEDTE